MFNVSLFCLMKLYISLWMVLGGLMMCWFVCMNFVYGCVVVICLSGGFCSRAILSRSNVVQFGVGVCVSIWLHVSILGLIVMINA